MDPYLEHPDIFPDLHDRLNAHLSEALQSNLPAPYFAVIGRRIWVEITKRYIGPDVHLLHGGGRRVPVESGGVALADPPRSMPKLVRVPHDERRQPFVEIYVGQCRDKRLVTTIEILSLSNKTLGEHGRDLYLSKQREILASKVHLVEIDLLRGGEHTTAVPQEKAIEEAGTYDYHVCVHHYDKLEDYFVYAIRLEQQLPVIDVPLLPGDPTVGVDLQAVFDRCYDAGPYRREVRYLEDSPTPALSPQQMAWSQKRIAAAPIGR